jgi:hypothetical protein
LEPNTTPDHYHRLLKRHGWSIGDVAFRDLATGRTTWLVTTTPVTQVVRRLKAKLGFRNGGSH